MGTVLNPSLAPSDGVSASQDYCVALNNNKIQNVFNGIGVGGDQVGTDGQNYMVADNTIDHFAGDGIDHSVTNIIIQGNVITNGLEGLSLSFRHDQHVVG